MGAVWMEVLPYALAVATMAAILRTAPLRQAKPGLAPIQRLGILLTVAPLAVLVGVGLTSLPRLFEPAQALPAPSQLLAGKAVLHLLLYLAVPVVGLLLVHGPRGLKERLPRYLVGDQPTGQGLARGLRRAAGLCAVLVTGILLGWSALADQAGLFSAEGPRVFFSQTTPAVALLLAGVAAIAEELLFRGVLLSHLRRVIAKHPAIWVQAGLFGLIHAGYGSVLHVAAATVFGGLMGYLAQRDGLLPPIVVHFVVNLAVLAAWAEEGALMLAAIGLVLALAGMARLAGGARRGPQAESQPSAS